MNPTRILIVGFGNPLMADDGVGPAVVAELRSRRPPAHVRIEEGGTDATRLRSLWGGEPLVWLVDALSSGAPPGTVSVLEHDRLLASPHKGCSAHELSLPECLRWLIHTFPEMGRLRYTLWGIEPASLRPMGGLSASVVAAIRQVTGAITARWPDP